MRQSVFLLIVLPEYNPFEMAIHQVSSYLTGPTLSGGKISEGLTSGMPAGYLLIAAISSGIILFSIASVYFHSQKKQKRG
jgi:hypothetical protein